MARAQAGGPMAIGMAAERVAAIHALARELQEGGGQRRRLVRYSVAELREAARPPSGWSRA